MSPGPVSDSYDPEFSTGENAQDVADGINSIVNKIDSKLGSELEYIVDVVHGSEGKKVEFILSEREMRIVRFGLNRALESI